MSTGSNIKFSTDSQTVALILDGEDVYGKDLEYVSKRIVGPTGTAVRLGFGHRDGSYVEVTMNRVQPVPT